MPILRKVIYVCYLKILILLNFFGNSLGMKLLNKLLLVKVLDLILLEKGLILSRM